MLNDLRPVRDVSVLRRGELLEVHRFGFPAYSGTILATMPKLNIVWIRTTDTGERKMLCADECQMRRR